MRCTTLAFAVLPIAALACTSDPAGSTASSSSGAAGAASSSAANSSSGTSGGGGGDAGTQAILMPMIDGDPWQIAGEPDLGALGTAGQQPVDFSVWQAADGTWQLWSCIRFTNVGGKSRLFYRWEGANVTDADWTPKGIAMQADPSVGETAGGLQAPHVMKAGGVHHMFYGDWEHVCHQTSADGKTFTRVLQGDGNTGMFTEGIGANTRDPMVIPIGDTFYLYYTASVSGQGADYCRTSVDMTTWSASTKVAFGGQAGTGGSSAECPFVVYRADQKAYYLFRTQAYGANAVTRVYRSPDPLDFGVDDDTHLLGTLPVAAPEVFSYGGQWYIAWLLPSLTGVQIAKLAWVPAP